MSRIRHSLFFKVIALVLVVTFLALDIAYAYPPEPGAEHSALSAPSLFQQSPPNDEAVKFKRSAFLEGAVVASACDIGEYYFGSS